MYRTGKITIDHTLSVLKSNKSHGYVHMCTYAYGYFLKEGHLRRTWECVGVVCLCSDMLYNPIIFSVKYFIALPCYCSLMIHLVCLKVADWLHNNYLRSFRNVKFPSVGCRGRTQESEFRKSFWEIMHIAWCGDYGRTCLQSQWVKGNTSWLR